MLFFQLFANSNDDTTESSIDSFIPKRSQSQLNKKPKNFNWKEHFSSHWQRLLFGAFLIICFLVLFSFIGSTFFTIIFTILPLFIGYGISFLLHPLIKYFAKFLPLKISKILVFVIFLILVLTLIFGILFVLIFQLDGLYQQLLQKPGDQNFQDKFLDKIEENAQIKNLSFQKASNQAEYSGFTLTYDFYGPKIVEEASLKPAIVTKVWQTQQIFIRTDEIGDIYIFFLKIISVAPFLQRFLFGIILTSYHNLSYYAWINTLMENYWFWLSFLYLVFFTLVIAAFTLDDQGNFFRKLWGFLTKQQDPATVELLSVELKRGFSSWFKALLLVQTYILIFTSFFIFIAGILFKWSGYLKSVLILAFFMFLCNLIPYIGPVIGFIPIIGIGIIDGIKHGGDQFISWVPLLIATLGCWFVQLGESAIVSPLVYSHKVQIKPITVIIGLTLFGVVFGVLSMPFAIPIIIFAKIIARIVYKQKWNI